MLMVLLAASAVIVVFSGGLADQAGKALGLGSAALTAWSYEVADAGPTHDLDDDAAGGVDRGALIDELTDAGGDPQLTAGVRSRTRWPSPSR